MCLAKQKKSATEKVHDGGANVVHQEKTHRGESDTVQQDKTHAGKSNIVQQVKTHAEECNAVPKLKTGPGESSRVQRVTTHAVGSDTVPQLKTQVGESSTVQHRKSQAEQSISVQQDKTQPGESSSVQQVKTRAEGSSTVLQGKSQAEESGSVPETKAQAGESITGESISAQHAKSKEPNIGQTVKTQVGGSGTVLRVEASSVPHLIEQVKKQQVVESSTVHQVQSHVRESGSVPQVKQHSEGSNIVQGVKKQQVVESSPVQPVKSQDGASSSLQQARFQSPLVSQPGVTLGASRGFLNALIEASKREINQQGNVSGDAVGAQPQKVAKKRATVPAKFKHQEKKGESQGPRADTSQSIGERPASNSEQGKTEKSVVTGNLTEVKAAEVLGENAASDAMILRQEAAWDAVIPRQDAASDAPEGSTECSDTESEADDSSDSDSGSSSGDSDEESSSSEGSSESGSESGTGSESGSDSSDSEEGSETGDTMSTEDGTDNVQKSEAALKDATVEHIENSSDNTARMSEHGNLVNSSNIPTLSLEPVLPLVNSASEKTALELSKDTSEHMDTTSQVENEESPNFQNVVDTERETEGKKYAHCTR